MISTSHLKQQCRPFWTQQAVTFFFILRISSSSLHTGFNNPSTHTVICCYTLYTATVWLWTWRIWAPAGKCVVHMKFIFLYSPNIKANGQSNLLKAALNPSKFQDAPSNTMFVIPKFPLQAGPWSIQLCLQSNSPHLMHSMRPNKGTTYAMWASDPVQEVVQYKSITHRHLASTKLHC